MQQSEVGLSRRFRVANVLRRKFVIPSVIPSWVSLSKRFGAFVRRSFAFSYVRSVQKLSQRKKHHADLMYKNGGSYSKVFPFTGWKRTNDGDQRAIEHRIQFGLRTNQTPPCDYFAFRLSVVVYCRSSSSIPLPTFGRAFFVCLVGMPGFDAFPSSSIPRTGHNGRNGRRP